MASLLVDADWLAFDISRLPRNITRSEYRSPRSNNPLEVVPRH